LKPLSVAASFIVGGFLALVPWGVSWLFVPDSVINGPVGSVVEWAIFLAILGGAVTAILIGAREVIREY
jgi:RsiW-degrading membrane proteinase PrsW (M82 family)